MDRREFLKSASGLLLPSSLLWQAGEAHAARFDRVRAVKLVRPAVNERAEIIYWDSGRVLELGRKQANRILRDVRANRSTNMSIELLDVLAWMQTWLRLNGVELPIYVNSGYRTFATNSSTEGAVKNSLHTLGLAADIWMPGIPTSYLGELVKRMEQGGVGTYVSKSFVHVDVGSIRSWKG